MSFARNKHTIRPGGDGRFKKNRKGEGMSLVTKYAPKQRVLIGGMVYEILSVKTMSTWWGCKGPTTEVMYHVEDIHSRKGCSVLEQMITRRIK